MKLRETEDIVNLKKRAMKIICFDEQREKDWRKMNSFRAMWDNRLSTVSTVDSPKRRQNKNTWKCPQIGRNGENISLNYQDQQMPCRKKMYIMIRLPKSIKKKRR